MSTRRRVRTEEERVRDRRPVKRIKTLPAGVTPVSVAATSPEHRQVVRAALTRLQDLGNDVASSLRGNASDKLRKAASLAIIGTLALTTAACDEEPTDDQSVEATVDQGNELTTEVSQGMPTETGKTYSVNPQSLMRDDRGVYYFEWTNPANNQVQVASASRLRLVESKNGQTELMTPAGEAPILSVPADVPINLTWKADGPSPTETVGPGTPTATPNTNTRTYTYVNNYYHDSYGGGFWNSAPWFAFGYMAGRSSVPVDPTASRPAFRDPPSGSAIGSNQPLSGSTASETPKPFSDRAVRGVAVSGMKSGTGSGTAVTGKTAGSKVGISSGTGSGSAATGKSVTSPKSGGFSTGKGGSSSGTSS